MVCSLPDQKLSCVTPPHHCPLVRPARPPCLPSCPLVGLLSRWILHGPAAVLHAALASLVLLRLHPRPMAHTPSFEFTTSFMGVS